MKKQVYEVDGQGFLLQIHLAIFDDDGNSIDELASNIVTLDPPNGLYRAKWAGTEWIEDMSQAEINALNRPTITSLKTQLTETDYKIIKCSEYQLAGMESPYDIITLHTERQALREQINALELTS